MEGSGDTTPCKVTLVILHGVASPCTRRGGGPFMEGGALLMPSKREVVQEARAAFASYRGTSLTRKRTPLGPYLVYAQGPRRVLGKWAFLMGGINGAVE